MSSDETLRPDATPTAAPTTTPATADATAVATAENPAASQDGAHGANGTASPPADSEPQSAAPQSSEPAERPRPQLNPTFGVEAAKPVANQGGTEAPKPAAESVSVPAKDDLDAEMQAEIDAAMASGELNLAGPKAVPSVPAAAEGDGAKGGSGKPTEEELIRGVRLTGKIQSVHGDDVFLDLGYRAPGVVQARQFESGKKPEPGQQIEVVVEKVDQANGLILVNLPRGLRKGGGNWDSLTVGQIVDCVVSKTNKGGLEVTISSIRGFLPASQVDLGFVSKLEPLVGQKLRVQVTEVNPKKKNLIVSRRAYLLIERKEAEENIWKTLEVGQKFGGRVKTVKDYGAFIDIGGVDGFLHIGEMSWTRIRHPADVLKEGQQVDVQVISLDREKKKIGLGLKQLAQNPWASAAEKYAVGNTVSGKVTRTTEFGAFVELEPGVEGLIHISEMDYKRIKKVTDVVKDGQMVDAKVLELDLDRRRISLSLKALKEKPEEPKVADEDLAPSAAAAAYAPKRRGPLKGGTHGGASGGGLFGNPRDFH